MIAISSYRPRDQSETIWQHQVEANKTWQEVFREIIYFGNGHVSLINPLTIGPIVEFLPCDGKPTIKEMARVASTIQGWSCIINADIQVSSKMKHLDRVLSLHQVDCGFSFRIPLGSDKPVDMGLDCFFATWHVWLQVFQQIPEKFTIGRQQWDTWMASFFMKHYKCADLTPSKLIYHPNHEERGDQSLVIDNPYLKNMTWRCKQITF